MKLSGNKVLVTGGGSGIGLEIAKALIKRGNKVIVCGRNLPKLEEVKSNNQGLGILQCDVANEGQVIKMRDQLEEEHGGVNIVINNAGVMKEISYKKLDVDLDYQSKEMDIDFMAPVRLIQHFLPNLRKQPNAVIVNVSSGLAFVPLSSIPVYCASKAALHSWTMSLRWQLRDEAIRVVELMPPLVDTGMVDNFKGSKMAPEKLAEEFLKGLARGKTEITPGQSSQLKLMSKLAPGFIFKMLNKQFDK